MMEVNLEVTNREESTKYAISSEKWTFMSRKQSQGNERNM